MVDAAWRGREALLLTVVASLYGVALLVWVAAIPSVDGETLLQYGGPGSLAITAQPLLFSLLMWALLHTRCTTGSRAATTAAWLLAPLYLGWSVLGALTLAAGAFPAAVLLLAALALTPTPGPGGCRET
jgi:hypothetical protein